MVKLSIAYHIGAEWFGANQARAIIWTKDG